MRRLDKFFEEYLSTAGIRLTQYQLLVCVVESGSCAQKDLACALEISASTLSRNLRPMCAAGWIEIQSGRDQRSHLVVATPAGLAKRAEARLQWVEAQHGLRQLVGQEQMDALHADFDCLLQLLGPPSGDSSSERASHLTRGSAA